MTDFSDMVLARAKSVTADEIVQDTDHPNVYRVMDRHRVELINDEGATCSCTHGQNNDSARCYHVAAVRQAAAQTADTTTKQVLNAAPVEDPEHEGGPDLTDGMTIAEMKDAFTSRDLPVPHYERRADLAEALTTMLEEQ